MIQRACTICGTLTDQGDDPLAAGRKPVRAAVARAACSDAPVFGGCGDGLMVERRVAPAPAGLGAAGRAVWRAILGDLAADWQLDAREIALLEHACSCADHVAALEAVVAAEGVTAVGSKGQAVTHPALVELRQQKLALQRLLAGLELDDPAAGRSSSPASLRARRAAQARWQGAA